MSDYSPPTENLPIFDVNVFNTGDEPLTYNEAKKKFLRYPNAQGTENLQIITVSGTSTFSNQIIQTGSTNKIIQDTTTNSDVNQLKATDIYGDLNLRKPTGTTGGAIRLWDVVSNSGNSSQLYTTGTQYAFQNLNNGGAITLNTRSSTGTQSQPLSVSSTDMTIQTTNPPTQTAVQPASSDSSNKIPTTAWVQSAIASGSGGGNDLTKNSLTITPNPSLSSLTGISNYYGIGAKYSQNWYGGGGRSITITITNVPTYTRTQASPLTYGNDYYSFTVDFSFFQSAQTGNWSGTTPPTTLINSNSGTIQLFPTRLTGTSVSVIPYGICRINNSINGNTSYSMYDANYAPNGRPYWCSNFQYNTWSGTYNTTSSTEVYITYYKSGTNTVVYTITSNGYTSGSTFPTMTNCTAEIKGSYYNNISYPMQIYFS